MEAVERWVDHERWCVRALAQGAKHLLEHESFLYGPLTGEEYDEDDERDDDFDEFMPQIVPAQVPSGLPVAALYEQE